MKKSLHMAKANIRKYKSSAASMIVIILVASALCTISLSVVLGVMPDYEACIERLNGLHSVFVMTKDMYLPSFEDVIRNDPRVSDYEIGEVIFNGRLPIIYGGELDHRVMILDADTAWKISAPQIIEENEGNNVSISRESAVYLPSYAQKLGFEGGGLFRFTYRNKPIDLVVAGFFEASEYAIQNGAALKFYVPAECFDILKRQMGSSVWITVRFNDPYDSTAFNEDFLTQTDVDIAFFSDDSYVMDFEGTASNAITPILILVSIIIVFALVIVVISLLVTRFRTTNSIEDSMHAIGVLKASGYKSGQIIAGYLVEISIIAIPAALSGILLAIPAFSGIRIVLEGFSGNKWTLGANIPVGLAAAALVVIVLQFMVLRSCRKIRILPPVAALRGETVSFSRRCNYFPLHKGYGSVHTRLGLKSMTAYSKRFLMISVVLAAATYVVIIIAAMYQNFVIDRTALIRMIGIEISDIDITVARHTDADALAAELEQLQEVRKTAMLDWRTFKVDGVSVMGFASNNYDSMETMLAHDGRFPKYDNEIALPKLFAERLGKVLGDSVIVKANGVTQEYIICGYFSTANNGGLVGALSLEGYQRLDPYYRRNNIKIYLNEGETVDDFSDLLKEKYGVVNVFHLDENDKFAASKARAEEKIANYLEFYGIDSVEYAVIYNGDIIISGTSEAYQIEKITDFKAWADSQIEIYGDIVKLLTQVISFISLGIIALILAMTARDIVVKRRRELGVLKSGGFTTGQLARQLAIGFLPCSALGVLVGCTGGALSVNPAITAMFATTGVYNANVYISPVAVAVIGVFTMLFTFTVANISAMRIKHITVYELLSE